MPRKNARPAAAKKRAALARKLTRKSHPAPRRFLAPSSGASTAALLAAATFGLGRDQYDIEMCEERTT